MHASRAARRETRVARPIAHCAAVHHPAATHHVLSSLHVERSPHLPGGGVGGWRDAHRSCMLADGRVLARHATRSHAARPHTARAHPPLLRAHLLASCKACSPTISSSRPAPRVPRRATRAARLAARHDAHRARWSRPRPQSAKSKNPTLSGTNSAELGAELRTSDSSLIEFRVSNRLRRDVLLTAYVAEGFVPDAPGCDSGASRCKRLRAKRGEGLDAADCSL